ncbi:MAG: LamG domain-containing protein, partial [Patescibacteria group bacterium]
EVATPFESAKYKLGGSADRASKDGGIYTGLYESGSSLTLMPIDYGDPSLVGYWTFNEGSGATSTDVSGHGNNGAWNGTLGSQWVTGKVGAYAGQFNGTDNKVTSGNITVGTNMTISIWIYKNTSTVQNSFFSNRSGFGQVYFGLYQPMQVFLYNNNGSPPGIFSASNAVQIGQWQYIVATSDGLTIKFFVNGLLIYTTNQTRNASTGAVGIGWDPAIGTEFWDGRIDDVRIYNRVLSAAEILALYNATK